jgi:putative acetyltransferase
MNSIVEYHTAQQQADFDRAKNLFIEYSQSLGFDLSFQHFEKELSNIQIQYYKPEGALIIAQTDQQYVGCTGIRRLDAETAELKRMYVQPAYRGHQIGAELLRRAILAASHLQYKRIRLDTVETMKEAQQLYRSFGFYEIPPYRYNPVSGTLYLEKII